MARILFYPSGTRELPSSHLRVYEVAEELKGLGHSVGIVDPSFENSAKQLHLDHADEGSIIYVQKVFQGFHRPENFLPYKQKYTIVYDVDDYHEGYDAGMMEMADLVVAGSHYVAEYAQQFNDNVHIACSITDTDVYGFVDRSNKSTEQIRIIWTESFANAYLEDVQLIAKPMKKMFDRHNVELYLQGLRENRQIPKDKHDRYGNLIPHFLRLFPYAKIQKFMSIDDYLIKGVSLMKSADIGVIPFKPDRVGKAGQNMRSLMSTGLGVIGTPGNEQEYVIDHGETGFLASTEEEWEEALEALITNKERRLQMGLLASQSIEERYSRTAYMKKIREILGL